MLPLAFVQTPMYAYLNDGLSTIYKFTNGEAATLEKMASLAKLMPSSSLVMKLILNRIIAFGLNVVSLTPNKNTDGLAMTVAANVKQMITTAVTIVPLIEA